MQLNNASGTNSLGTTSTITITSGGTFSVNANTGPLGNLNLGGGTFGFTGAASTASSLQVGIITLNPGSSAIAMTPGASGSVALTGSALVRNTGATIDFTGAGLGTTSNTVTITAGLQSQLQGDNGGILPYAAVNGGDFATYGTVTGSSPTVSSIQTFTGYQTNPNPSSWLSGDTVKLTPAFNALTDAVTPVILPGTTTINALVLAGTNSSGVISFGENGNTLTLTSGGLLQGPNSLGATIEGGTLAFGTGGTGEAIVSNYSPAFGPGLLAQFYNQPLNVDGGVLDNGDVTVLTSNNLASAGQEAAGHLPNLATPPAATRIDPGINYSPSATGLAAGVIGPGDTGIPSGVSATDMGVLWSGYLNIVTAGNYTITTASLDGTNVYIDGKLVVTGVSATGAAATIPLSAGLHTFSEIYQKENTVQNPNTYLVGVATIWSLTTVDQLYYLGPDTGGNTVIVPPAASSAAGGLLTAGAVETTINSSIVAGNLTVGGTGVLDLPTANNFAGTTFLAGSPIAIPSTVGGSLAGTIAGGGTLVVGANGSLGTSTLDMVGGTIESSDAVTLGNKVALNGSAIVGGSNNLTFNGTGSVSGSSATQRP